MQIDINPAIEDEIKVIKSKKNARMSYKFRDIPLSERELEVLSLFTKGYNCKEISNILNISSRTVETYKKRLFYKYGVYTTLELVCFCYGGYVKDEEQNVNEKNSTI